MFYCSEDKANLKEIDSLLERKTLKSTKRIVAWCLRFSLHCRANRSWEKRQGGPLATEEIENADKKLIRNAQEQMNLESEGAQQLGFNKCEDKVIRCFGRIPDYQPIFVPRQSLYAVKMGEEVH